MRQPLVRNATYRLGRFLPGSHGDLTITESNTILGYLAGNAGREDLHPGEPAARARVDMLLDALSLSVRPALWGLEEPLVYALPVADAELAARRTVLEAAMDGWERMLAANALALPALKIADVAMAGRLVYLDRLLDRSDAWPVTARRPAAGARPARLRRGRRWLAIRGEIARG
jgi:glutathione S-transferase